MFNPTQSKDWVIKFATTLVNRIGPSGFLCQMEYPLTIIPSIRMVIIRVKIKSFWNAGSGKQSSPQPELDPRKHRCT